MCQQQSAADSSRYQATGCLVHAPHVNLHGDGIIKSQLAAGQDNMAARVYALTITQSILASRQASVQNRKVATHREQECVRALVGLDLIRLFTGGHAQKRRNLDHSVFNPRH